MTLVNESNKINLIRGQFRHGTHFVNKMRYPGSSFLSYNNAKDTVANSFYTIRSVAPVYLLHLKNATVLTSSASGKLRRML